MPEGDTVHIPDYITLPQAIRWVGFALPPLSARFECLENYPAVTEPIEIPEGRFLDPLEWEMYDGHYLGKPERLASDSTIDASLRLVLRSLALAEVKARGWILRKGPEDAEYQSIADHDIPEFVWDYRRLCWSDFSGAWIHERIEDISFIFCAFRLDFLSFAERFPKPPYRHEVVRPEHPARKEVLAENRPGPPPAKAEAAKAIAAALLNELGDDPTSINRALYERNVAAAWDAVYGPGTAPAPKTIRRALDDLAEGERTLAAAKAAGWRWEE